MYLSYNNILYDGNYDNKWSEDNYYDNPQQYKFSNRRPYISDIIYDGQENSNTDLSYVKPIEYIIDPNFSESNISGEVPLSVFQWMVNEGNNISENYKFLGSDNRRPDQIYKDSDGKDLTINNCFQHIPSYLTYQPNCTISVNYGGEYKSFYYLYPKRMYSLTIKIISTLFNDDNKDLNSISLHNPTRFNPLATVKASIKNTTGITKNISDVCKDGENIIFNEKYNDRNFLSSTINLDEFKQNVEYNGGNTDLILTKDF